MGEAFYGALPRCPVHGQMYRDFPAYTWRCAGWDGEVCGHTVTDEEIRWRWQPLGEVCGSLDGAGTRLGDDGDAGPVFPRQVDLRAAKRAAESEGGGGA